MLAALSGFNETMSHMQAYYRRSGSAQGLPVIVSFILYFRVYVAVLSNCLHAVAINLFLYQMKGYVRTSTELLVAQQESRRRSDLALSNLQGASTSSLRTVAADEDQSRSIQGTTDDTTTTYIIVASRWRGKARLTSAWTGRLHV